MKIEKRTEQTPLGEVTLITLTNASGASATVSTLGAGIVGIVVPDRDGKLADVALGYAAAADYIADGPCMGKTPGRYANRIGKGRFAIDSTIYDLAINNGPNALHGGPTGFMNRIWAEESRGSQVKMEYTAADGEEGYPGTLKATVIYTWTDDNVLTIDYMATTDRKTVVNLTNHAYFNLDGEDAGSVLGHKLTLMASHYLPTDDTLIPSGEIAPVEGTPMDFTKGRVIGADIKADFPALNYGKGYDNCWVIDDWHKHTVGLAARLEAERSGRVMEVLTSQPAAQVYTGNWLAGCPKSKSGREYADYDGVAIECQGFPDAPNHHNFPSQLLGPGQAYEQRIIYKFSVNK